MASEISSTEPGAQHREKKAWQLASRLERHSSWLFAAFTLALLAVTLLLDAKRPFWNDELFTYYVSRQPSLEGVISALRTGAEQLPVFFFVIIRLFTASPTAGPIAFRLPETLGFLVMCLSCALFTRRRIPAVYASLAFLLPALTDAYSYAYEARPYGLVMGFAGLALLCWQSAASSSGPGRRWPLAGLALFLTCATNCHYYAVLLLFPFGVAELARYAQRRKLDFSMYLAIAVAPLSLLFSLPLILAASQYSHHFWAKPGWTSLVSFYEVLLMPSSFALFLILVVAGLYRYFAPNSPSQPPVGTNRLARPESPPLHESAVAAGFAALPIVAIAIAKFVTGAFTSRYALCSILGLSILFAWAVSRLGRKRLLLGFMLVGLTFACWLVVVVRQYKRFVSTSSLETETFRSLVKSENKLPLVIASPHEFFVQSHHADVEHQGNFLYLADVPLALKYSDTDTVERGLLALKHYAPLHVMDYRRFVSEHPYFLLYGDPGPFGWLPQELLRTGRTLTVLSQAGGMLYLVGPADRPLALPAASSQ